MQDREDYDEPGGRAWDGWPTNVGTYVGFVAFVVVAVAATVGLCVRFCQQFHRWQDVAMMWAFGAVAFFVDGLAFREVTRQFLADFRSRRAMAESRSGG